MKKFYALQSEQFVGHTFAKYNYYSKLVFAKKLMEVDKLTIDFP